MITILINIVNRKIYMIILWKMYVVYTIRIVKNVP